MSYFLISCSWSYYRDIVKSVEKETGLLPSLWTVGPNYLKEHRTFFPNINIRNAHDFTCGDIGILYDLIGGKLDFEVYSERWQKEMSSERLYVLENLLHRSDPGGSYTHKEIRDTINSYFFIADNLIKYFKPKVIYFEVAPHTMYDLAMYFVAQKYCVNTVFRIDTSMPCLSVFARKINDASSFIDPKIVGDSGFEIKEEIFSSYINHIKESNPFYISKSKYGRGPSKMLKDIASRILGLIRFNAFKYVCKLKENLIWTDVQIEKQRSGYRKIKGFPLHVKCEDQADILKHELKNCRIEFYYHRISKEFDNVDLCNLNYIYIPLSLQHEMSTMPSAGHMFDQMCYIKMIVASLPVGYKIVIKENPKQFTHTTGVPNRCISFYDEIIKLGVLIAPLDFSSKKLIEFSKCIAVTTGTAGFEAVVAYSKPIMMFAQTWYSGIPGSRYIETFSECSRALSDLALSRWQVNESDVKQFLKLLSTKCVYSWGEGTTINEQGWDVDHIVNNSAKCIQVYLD